LIECFKTATNFFQLLESTVLIECFKTATNFLQLRSQQFDDPGGSIKAPDDLPKEIQFLCRSGQRSHWNARQPARIKRHNVPVSKETYTLAKREFLRMV